jgi:hypothetical protein
VSFAAETIIAVFGSVRQGDHDVKVVKCDEVSSLSIISFRTVLRAA